MNMENTLSTPAVRRDFWRRFTVLLLTIAGQNIIVYGVNLLDNIMIGRLGDAAEVAISGVFIVNQIQCSDTGARQGFNRIAADASNAENRYTAACQFFHSFLSEQQLRP